MKKQRVHVPYELSYLWKRNNINNIIFVCFKYVFVYYALPNYKIIAVKLDILVFEIRRQRAEKGDFVKGCRKRRPVLRMYLAFYVCYMLLTESHCVTCTAFTLLGELVIMKHWFCLDVH